MAPLHYTIFWCVLSSSIYVFLCIFRTIGPGDLSNVCSRPRNKKTDCSVLFLDCSYEFPTSISWKPINWHFIYYICVNGFPKIHNFHFYYLSFFLSVYIIDYKCDPVKYFFQKKIKVIFLTNGLLNFVNKLLTIFFGKFSDRPPSTNKCSF